MTEDNAPAPEIMREEFINIILKENPACGRFRAANIVDAILKKQMAFYSQMAEAELDTSDVEAAVELQTLSALVVSLIQLGAGVSQYMTDKEKWIKQATRTRDCLTRLQEMVG